MIETNRLTKIFKPQIPLIRRLGGRGATREVVALRDVNLSINAGEIFGLVGRNAQGKTTLIKSIATLLEPTAGSVKVFGLDAARHARVIRKRIGLVTSEERSFYGRLSGLQNLLFFARLNGLPDTQSRRRIRELGELFEFTPQLHRRYHELSTGNKQRLALMRALLTDPPLLLLDEPTRSLDPLAADELRHLLRKLLSADLHKAIVITSHNLTEIEDLCDRIGILSRGELKLCASMTELRARFYNRERITILARGGGIGEYNGLGRLRERIPSLELAPQPSGELELRFVRASGDGLLSLVLDRLISRGAEIVACHADGDTLREIMAAIEDGMEDIDVSESWSGR